MENTNKIDVSKGDPIAQLVINRTVNCSYLISFIFFFIGIIPIILFYLTKSINFSSENILPIEDFGYFNIFLLSTPTLILIISLYFSKFPIVINQLKENKILMICEKEWNKFINKSNNNYSNKIALLIPYFIGILGIIFALSAYIYKYNDNWYSIYIQGKFNYISIFVIICCFLFYYSASFLIVKIIISYINLKIVFSKEVKIQPLHPDQCGGLNPLGELSKTLNIGTFLFGIIVFLGIIINKELYNLPINNKVNFIMVFAYIFSAFVVFFIPLYAAHKSMRNSKLRILSIINESFKRKMKKL